MDALRKQKFNQAMFSKNRTLAIRVGKYQSSDIKEASFDYGYIKGDTYKPGGTCAGSAKIVFTSVITTFNKLDKVYPEVGLLVDGTYEWVKMGEYFINDIEIDRNRNTTKLDLMDGMFKLNREHVTELTYPAEIRHVIKEICLKTGIELANEYMDITSMNYRIEQIPKDKKMTFRDVLSLATQMLGMSCFFNREGKLEIKGLTDSGITITADSYFMHGLTKSEIEYQIAGISCKKNKEVLTVGLRTGRSLEIENLLMSQSALDNLYHNIKDIRYYPFNLNYQGHLLLDVGQWVTIKTNTGETFKSPVLSQSFTFKGGLRGRISADSKAGNDAQYSYAGTITKKIEQFNEIEAQIQSQLEEADKGFDQKVEKIKNDFSDQVELAKAKTEEVKRELSDTINQRFDSFENGPLQDAKRKAIEALQNAGASSLLAQEAKRIGLESVAKLDALKQTAEALQSDLLGINTYINEDVRRQEALYRYVYEEGERQATAVREQINQDFVNKSTYQEDARGIERRFEAITNPQNGLIATQIANYKTAVDGRFADITSLIAGKANQIDFQRVKETSQLYERIIGNNDNSISNNIARMALTNQLFQVEVAKASASGRNLFLSSTATKGYLGRAGVINVANSTQKEITSDFISVEPNEKIIFQHWVTLPENGMAFSAWQFFDKNKEAIDARVTGSNAYKMATGKQHNINQIIVPANANFIRVSARMYNDGLIKIERSSAPSNYSAAPEDNDEAIRTVQRQIAGSWSVQNINSAGDLISGINLGANGYNRFDGKLTHITGETLIDNAVIKSAMVDKLKTANFEAGSVTTVILDAEAVTAEKLKVDQAFFNKLVANEAYLNQLFAKQAFINRVQSISINASQVKAGFLSGDRILGGTITGSNIYGGTLTGHTQIQLGTYGSFDTVNGGIQINVPRTVNAKDGLGVQFIGSYGRGENVPYGLFIYKDSDFTVGGTAETSDDFLLTVEGYINAKGIGWLKTGKGSVNGKTTGTIGLWNSDNVSLSFGGSGNDIYYSYNGTAYSLWSVVNQHFSDRRLKENIVECKNKALDYIQQFQFKEYDWKKQDDRPRQAHTKIGLIAQEVQAVDPTLVYENGDTLNLDNLRLTNIALKAIQELSQRIETLERELA